MIHVITIGEYSDISVKHVIEGPKESPVEKISEYIQLKLGPKPPKIYANDEQWNKYYKYIMDAFDLLPEALKYIEQFGYKNLEFNIDSIPEVY